MSRSTTLLYDAVPTSSSILGYALLVYMCLVNRHQLKNERQKSAIEHFFTTRNYKVVAYKLFYLRHTTSFELQISFSAKEDYVFELTSSQGNLWVSAVHKSLGLCNLPKLDIWHNQHRHSIRRTLRGAYEHHLPGKSHLSFRQQNRLYFPAQNLRFYNRAQIKYLRLRS